MNFLFGFAPKFVEWPLAVIGRLQQELPDARFYGVVTKEKDRPVTARVRKSDLLADVVDLPTREPVWLSRRVAPEDLARWDAFLGVGALNRIFLSDRFLCPGFVQSDMPATALGNAVRNVASVRAYLHGLLEELDAYLTDHAIDCVFTYVVDSAPTVALAELCRARGLRFLRLTNTRVDGKFVVEDDPWGTLSVVERRYHAARTAPGLVADHLPAAGRFLSEFRKEPRAAPYMTRNRGLVLRDAAPGRLIGRALKLPVAIWRWRKVASVRVVRPRHQWRAQLRQVVRARLERRNDWIRDLAGEVSGRFAFFPLHVEPEASTMVMAPTLPGQLAVIEALAKSLPLDMTLLVKEHPTMIGRRPPHFYEAIVRLPRCRLVEPAVPGVELVSKAAITCAISSTAAWEAMLLRRPALVFGKFPFAGLGEGVVECSDFAELPQTIATALSQPPIQEHNLELYLAALFDVGFDLPFELLWGRVTKNTVSRHPEVADNIATGILRCLDERHDGKLGTKGDGSDVRRAGLA